MLNSANTAGAEWIATWRSEMRGGASPQSDSDTQLQDSWEMLVAKCRRFVDPQFYLACSPDVRQLKLDPTEHYLRFGWNEGRDPNEFFHTRWYEENTPSFDGKIPALLHYVLESSSEGSCSPIFDSEFVRENYLVGAIHPLEWAIAYPDLLDRTCAWFSRKFYMEEYADWDVGFSSPDRHFLSRGLGERRIPSDSCRVFAQNELSLDSQEAAFRFTWKSTGYVVVRSAISTEILQQIEQQGAFDTRVFAPGADALANLPEFRADDLDSRDLVNWRSLLSVVHRNPELLIVLPAFRVGGAEKYVASLATLASTEDKRVAVLTTEDDTISAEVLSWKGLRGLLAAEHIPFNTLAGKSYRAANLLALYLMYVRPRNLLVTNSEVGLTVLSRYGLVLSQLMRLATTFFSEAPRALGGPYPTRFLGSVIQYADIWSDNQHALDGYSERLDGHFAKRLRCVPQFVEGYEDRDFLSQLRRSTAGRSRREPRVLWIGRWDPFKATDVLVEFARKAENIEIDVYSTTIPSMADKPPNMTFRGLCSDVRGLDLTRYDALVFTSKFEGMPNVVLELAAMGVPVVASDVGGLRETFPEGAIDLVTMSDDTVRVARQFADAVRAIVKLSDNAWQARITKARNAVQARHSWTAFQSHVAAAYQTEE